MAFASALFNMPTENLHFSDHIWFFTFHFNDLLRVFFFGRKYLSLQSVAETVVQEIRKLLQVQPMLVLATKTNILGMGAITSDVKRFVHEIVCIHAMPDIFCCF